MTEQTQTALPERLTLQENGYWEPRQLGMNTMNRDPDDEQWISRGWKVVTFEGKRFFEHQQKGMALQWLIERGYVDTGDGAHFQQQASFQSLRATWQEEK